MALVALGSLTPFRFAPEAWANWRFGALELTELNRADALANIAVYLPMGALLFAALRRRLPALLSAAIAVAVTGGLSFSMESLQAAILTRFPSWSDVALNVLGSVVGIVLAAQFAALAGRAARAVAVTSASSTWQRYISTPVLLVCWLVVAAAVAADGLRGFINVIRGSATLHGTTVPLTDYFYQPFLPVAGWLVEIAVVYAALAWTLSALRVRISANARRTWWIVAITTLVVATIGVLEVNGRWSISDAIIGAAAMLVSWVCYTDLHRVCKREMHVSDVLETERRRAESAERETLRKIMYRRAFGHRQATT